MPLSLGTRVGPYEITAPLGEGGMGVVFRARDVKLQRDVALKLLPDHLAYDSDRLKRFEREAQLLASLNHPNIAHVHGLEPIASSGADGAPTLHAIAMELVDGETLSEHIVSTGSLPADEVVAIATQIVAALEAAHERGIVHRDLKPSNIKLTANGTVKVLDFGLAKDVGATAPTAALSTSPTMTHQSMPGVILGTLAYMAPEQARGKAVDARADIWAFGCVVFEMFAGRPPFDGETATDVIAKIVSGEPDWSRLPKTVPASLRQLLRVTLTKEPRLRLQHIGDSRLFLTPGLQPADATAIDNVPRSRRMLWMASSVALAFAGVAALVSVMWLEGRGSSPAPVMRFEIPAPGLGNGRSIIASLAISPDGKHIAYTATQDGRSQLWVRPIDATAPRALAGTDGAVAEFWAPDSRQLAFFADGKLKKVDVMSGSVQTLGDAGATVGGAWSREGVILFNADPLAQGKLLLGRVSASGGDVASIDLTDSNVQRKGFLFASLPRFLPDGRHFLYHVVAIDGSSFAGSLHVRSLDGGPPVRLANLGSLRNDGADGNSAISFVAPGYLLFTRGGTLMAEEFDVDRLQMGDPVAIAENVSSFAASDTGVLVYTHAPPPGTSSSFSPAAQQLTWFSRSGKIEGQLGARTYVNPKISPDQRRVAVQALESGTNIDIWTLDVTSGVPSRLTFDAAPDDIPIWSPSGDRILFASSRNSPIPFPDVLYTRASSGAGEDQLLLRPAKPGELNVPQDWSPDARYVLYSVSPLQRLTTGELWALPLFGDKKPIPLVQPKIGIAGAARFSPDGRWIAYTTNESGSNEVVVRPFPETSKGIWQVPGGGREPVWRGKEIFYLSSDLRAMMAVSVTTENDQIQFGRPVELFKLVAPLPQTNPPQFHFDVSRDGQRFLLNLSATAAAPQTLAPPGPPTSINVVVNWTATLPKK